ncbi:MAG: hypothetical protein FRX49_01376 [Trebouxia sp. A1-2]|nr:MAG: hypothetical protein FRX49_01376 [Trebouxia sp. A1-2]
MQTRRGKRKHEQVDKRCSKLPAKLQGYIMPDRKPQKAPSAKQQAAAPCSASQPKGAKMLFFNKPCCATSVRKLTIKLGGSALASHQASIPPPQPKPSLRLKLKSPLTRPATHTADPPPSLPLAQSQKQTLPNAKRFKPAPVERPVTRHFKRQQTTKSKVHLRLRPPAQSAVTQRKSTLTHQQKRHGPNIIRSTGQAEQRSRSQDTHLLTACTQSLPGGAAAAVHQSDMGHAPAAGWAAGLADDAARRGLKRRATTSGASQPPYKLIPANKAAIILPVLLYSSPVAAASQQNAKRRHIGPSGGAFPTPWSLLTSHGASSPVQRLLRARSLFGEATPMGSRGMFNGPTRNICNEQHTLASNTERVAHWQREQRELLQCLLQQQVANFNHSSATAQTSQAGTTSSVSYVTASASRQVGAVASLPCLPAIVIRPSNLSHSTSATVATNLACLKSQPQCGVHLDFHHQQQQQQSLQEAATRPMTQQQQQQQQQLPQLTQAPQQLHLQSQTWPNPPLQQQSLHSSGPALMSTSDEGCAATIAANSNDVCLSADRGLTREAVIPTTCSEDVKQPEAFGSFVEQLLDAAAWPEDIAATGDETAAAAERCEEEEDQTLQAEQDQTACTAEAGQTACMDPEDEPAWLEEKDQTVMGERGEGPKIAEEGQIAMAEQDQTALGNKHLSLGQGIGQDKGEGQQGTLDEEEAGKGRGEKPMEEEDKEAEDEPEELVDGRTPSSPRPCLNTFEGIVLPEQDGGQLKMYSLSSRLEILFSSRGSTALDACKATTPLIIINASTNTTTDNITADSTATNGTAINSCATTAVSPIFHPWEDQLTGLQASDAASQLVLAVAAATAASPGERAQAGQFPWPYYLIGTRDSFTNELVKLQTQVCSGSRRFVKTEFFFKAGEEPDNFQQVLSAVKPAAGNVKASSLPPKPTHPLSITHAVTPTPPDSPPQQHSHQQQSDAVMPEAVQSSPQVQTPSCDDNKSPPTPSMSHVSSILKPPTKPALARVMQPDSQCEAPGAASVSEARDSFQEQGLQSMADTDMTEDAEVVPQQEATAPDTVMSEARGLGHQLSCRLAFSGRGVDGSSHSQQGQLPIEQGGELFEQHQLPVEQGQLLVVEDQLSKKQSQLPVHERQLLPGLSQLPIKQSQVPYCDTGRGCAQSRESKAVSDKVTSTPPQSDADCIAAGGHCHQPEAVAASADKCTDADSSARGDNRAARDSPGADQRPAGTDSGGLCPVGITTYTQAN